MEAPTHIYLEFNGERLTYALVQPVRSEQPAGEHQVIPDDLIKCKCGEVAKVIDGIAKSGKNEGKPYRMYVCPLARNVACDFRKFTDPPKTTQSHVQPDLDDEFDF